MQIKLPMRVLSSVNKHGMCCSQSVKIYKLLFTTQTAHNQKCIYFFNSNSIQSFKYINFEILCLLLLQSTESSIKITVKNI